MENTSASMGKFAGREMFSPGPSRQSAATPKPLPMKLQIGPVIARRRMSQTQLADAVGVQKGYLSEIVSGKKLPSLDTFMRLCDVLKATPNELFGIDRPLGFSEGPQQFRTRAVLEALEAPVAQSAPQDLKIGTDGKMVQVIATVDVDGLDRLLRQLQALRAVLLA
jgi:transcriptional regulator with XRE-family HTH domain